LTAAIRRCWIYFKEDNFMTKKILIIVGILVAAAAAAAGVAFFLLKKSDLLETDDFSIDDDVFGEDV